MSEKVYPLLEQISAQEKSLGKYFSRVEDLMDLMDLNLPQDE